MAGALDAVKGAFENNTGSIEKAVIEILDLRGKKITEQDPVRIRAKENAGLEEGVQGPDMKQDAGSLTGNSQSKINVGVAYDQVYDANQLGHYGNISQEELKKQLGGTSRFFTVQFNPSTLKLSGHGGGLVQSMDFNLRPEYGKRERGAIDYTVADTTISLSVSLIFDAMDPLDSFMSDKFNISPTAVATGVTKGIMSATGNKKLGNGRYPVQTEVEAFMAALRCRYTRGINFNWGDFCYSGVLRSVGATYTMFNINGEPVRANVELTIMCADSTNLPNSLPEWQERYKTIFASNALGSGSRSYSKTNLGMGNFINI